VPPFISAFEGHQYMMYHFQDESSQVIESRPSWKIFPGQAFPLGVSEVDSGINFSIFSKHATAVTLCLVLPER